MVDYVKLVGSNVVAEQLVISGLFSVHRYSSMCHFLTLNAPIFTRKDRTFDLIVITEHHNGILRGLAHLGIVEVTTEVEV